MSRHHLFASAVVVLTTTLLSASRADDKPPPPAKAVNPAAVKLIDKLVELAESDTCYTPSGWESSFAPLPRRDPMEVGLPGQRPSTPSDTFRELVKLGAVAVPDLVAHLDDKRPTRFTVRLYIEEENKDGKLITYNLQVGDLCTAALGQIVNRFYRAVTNEHQEGVFVFTPTHDAKIHEQLKKEWGDLTPEKHRKSLLKDCEGKGNVDTRAGAFLRLGWYYPDALEAPALQFLARPAYGLRDSWEIVREKLYKETDAKKRRELFDAYVKKMGEPGRDGIRVCLFNDLFNLETSLAPKPEFAEMPKQLLIELYGMPKNVTYKDAPVPESISTRHVEEVIANGLSYDRSAKIDQAVRDLLAKTTDNGFALACMKRLVGRGFDTEIEAYYHRHEKGLSEYQSDRFKEFLQKAGWSPLHVAVWRGQQERITELLREGAKVNARAKDERTPLHVAVFERNALAIKLLLDAGADQKATDARGQTPANVAALRGDTEALQLLVTAGAPIDIFVAALLGKTEEMAEFLRKDKEAFRAKDSVGLTPLHRAAEEGHVKILEQLLDAGAEVNIASERGVTPLHLAANFGHVEACKLLIQRKAKVEQLTGGGFDMQAIHLAAQQGHLEVVKLLVEKGAKVNARGYRETTPLHQAAGSGHLAVVKWLVENKADINAKDKNGNTPLDIAYQRGQNKDVLQFLIEHGAKYKADD